MTIRMTAGLTDRNDPGRSHRERRAATATALPRPVAKRGRVRYEWQQGRLPGDRYVRVVRCGERDVPEKR